MRPATVEPTNSVRWSRAPPMAMSRYLLQGFSCSGYTANGVAFRREKLRTRAGNDQLLPVRLAPLKLYLGDRAGEWTTRQDTLSGVIIWMGRKGTASVDGELHRHND